MKKNLVLMLVLSLFGCSENKKANSQNDMSLYGKQSWVKNRSTDVNSPSNGGPIDYLTIYGYFLGVRCDSNLSQAYLQLERFPYLNQGESVYELSGENKFGEKKRILLDGTSTYSQLIDFFNDIDRFTIAGKHADLPFDVINYQGNSGSLMRNHTCYNFILTTK